MSSSRPLGRGRRSPGSRRFGAGPGARTKTGAPRVAIREAMGRRRAPVVLVDLAVIGLGLEEEPLRYTYLMGRPTRASGTRGYSVETSSSVDSAAMPVVRSRRHSCITGIPPAWPPGRIRVPVKTHRVAGVEASPCEDDTARRRTTGPGRTGRRVRARRCARHECRPIATATRSLSRGEVEHAAANPRTAPSSP